MCSDDESGLPSLFKLLFSRLALAINIAYFGRIGHIGTLVYIYIYIGIGIHIRVGNHETHRLFYNYDTC
jgi:hypothetical protein